MLYNVCRYTRKKIPKIIDIIYLSFYDLKLVSEHKIDPK